MNCLISVIIVKYGCPDFNQLLLTNLSISCYLWLREGAGICCSCCLRRSMPMPQACAGMIRSFRLFFSAKTELTIPQRDGQFFNGGDGGNRTPVRKHFDRNFSGRRRSFAFPHPGAGRHARGFGSFMMRGAGKAYCTHVPHSSTLPPGPWASRVERSLIKQREEQCYRCSLIYKSRPF